jgi:hypothetical protein
MQSCLCGTCAWRFNTPRGDTIASATRRFYCGADTTAKIDPPVPTCGPTCGACLGMLSRRFVRDLATQLVAKFHTYELPAAEDIVYRVELHVPSSVDVVRHGITARHLGISHLDAPSIPTVRNVLVPALGMLCQEALHHMARLVEAPGGAASSSVHFDIEVVLINAHEAADMRAVIPPNAKPIQRRKRRKIHHPCAGTKAEGTTESLFPIIPVFDKGMVMRSVNKWCDAGGALGPSPGPAPTLSESASSVPLSMDVDASVGLGAGGNIGEHPPVPAPVPAATAAASVPLLPIPAGFALLPPAPSVLVRRAPVFLRGRYVKNQRGLSQSPWFVDNKRIGSSSVQEMLCDHIAKTFGARAYKFHSAGREDMDVRMLGNGRPCVIQLLDAQRNVYSVLSHSSTSTTSTGSLCSASSSNCSSVGGVGGVGGGGNAYDVVDLGALAQRVADAHNGAVELHDLRAAGPDCMADMLAGAEHKRKTYACLVRLSRPYTQEDLAKLNTVCDLEIVQRTPIRVLHRRTQIDRTKTVHWMRCEEMMGASAGISKRCFVLRMATSAGAYVKEIVHGDRGRTVPNVGSMLGCAADILQLDVDEIVMTSAAIATDASGKKTTTTIIM